MNISLVPISALLTDTRNSLFCFEIKRRITNIALIGLVDIFNCSYALSEIQNRNRAFPPNDYWVSKRRFTALSNIFLLNALNE